MPLLPTMQTRVSVDAIVSAAFTVDWDGPDHRQCSVSAAIDGDGAVVGVVLLICAPRIGVGRVLNAHPLHQKPRAVKLACCHVTLMCAPDTHASLVRRLSPVLRACTQVQLGGA